MVLTDAISLLLVPLVLIGLLTLTKWIGEGLSALERRTSRRAKPPATASREDVLELLVRIRHEPDPMRALDETIAALRGVTLDQASVAQQSPPTPVTLAPPPSSPPPQILQRPTVLTASPEPLPAAVKVPPPLRVEQPAVPAVALASSPVASQGEPAGLSALWRWLDLDNITLLLYLGAALVVIAISVFVGSNWSVISGMARWGVISTGALAFLGVGEVFVRRSPVLARAGETFRGLGIVLLPFLALAYDRFVLNGAASPAFWAGSSALLALVYYALFRWIQSGRLTAYLAAFSLGVLALRLPESFGFNVVWRAPALLALGCALLAAVWTAERDGHALVARLRSKATSPLIESHLLVGAISLAGSTLLVSVPAPVFDSERSLTVYLLLMTGLLIATSAWFRNNLLAAAAALIAGVALMRGAGLFFLPQDAPAWVLEIAWNGLACALFLLAPLAERRLAAGTDKLLTGSALLWSLVALNSAYSGRGGFQPGLVAGAALLFAALWTATALRYRQPWPLAAAWIMLHTGLLDALRLFPPSKALVAPTLLWLALAAVWLIGNQRRRPSWAVAYWPLAFVAEALWTTAFASFDAPAAVVAGLALSAGWVVWSAQQRSETGIALAIVQGLYSEFALAHDRLVPHELLPFLTVAFAAGLATASPRLAAYARRVTRIVGSLLLLVSPLAGILGLLLGAQAAGWTTQEIATQAALALAAVVSARLAVQKPSLGLVAIATLQAYLLVCWLTVDYLPAPVAPFIMLVLALITLWIAPRAPAKAGIWLDPLARTTILLAPLAGVVAWEFGGAAGWWMTQTMAAQAALALSALFYGLWSVRRASSPLMVITTGQVYLLVGWLTVDYLPAPAAPFIALALALVTLWVAPRAPAKIGAWLDALGLLVILFVPLTGVFAQDLGARDSIWLTQKVAAQVTLALAATIYAWLTVRRSSRELLAATTAQAYLLALWLISAYLATPLWPLAIFALALATLCVAPHTPVSGAKWLVPLALLTALLAPLAGGIAAIWQGDTVSVAGLRTIPASQITLLLTAVLYGVRGWLHERRGWIVLAAYLVYLLYAWLAGERQVTALQMYSVPLAAVTFALSRLYRHQERAFDLASALILLVPAAFQSLADPDLAYSLLLGCWGLALLVAGISLGRRVPLAAGVAAILLAALRQIWNVAAELPPGVVIGVVGLAFMALAVLLTLRRHTLLQLRDLGSDYWERLRENP